eukprot:6915511-Prymnesium_polylepis.1
MYTILQKLDNIECAIDRYDETKRISFDTVPCRSAAAGLGVDLAKLEMIIDGFLQSFVKLVRNESGNDRKRISVSHNKFDLNLIYASETQFRMNASRKQTDSLRYIVTETYNLPEAEKMSDTAKQTVGTLNELWFEEKQPNDMDWESDRNRLESELANTKAAKKLQRQQFEERLQKSKEHYQKEIDTAKQLLRSARNVIPADKQEAFMTTVQDAGITL